MVSNPQRMSRWFHAPLAGLMATRKLIVFKHDSNMGNAPAHALFERVRVRRKEGVAVPRDFGDYDVDVDQNDLPSGVSVIEVV